MEEYQIGPYGPSSEEHGLQVSSPPAGHIDGVPFSSQLQFASVPPGQNARYPLNMSGMAGALPMLPHMGQQRAGSYNSRDMLGNMSPSTLYGMHQSAQYANHPPAAYGADPNAVRSQQQQFVPQHYGGDARQRQQQMAHGIPAPMMPYGYGMNVNPYAAADPRFAAQAGYGGYGMQPPPMPQEYAQFQRRQADNSAPVPSFPRGPPRKPKQSGHALWVGNLPSSAQVTDLKDHFSRDATKDIVSLFLISKSNCAFVNYRTEAACVAAMNRFHDSRFGGVRLVCRLRRGGSTTTASTVNGTSHEPNKLDTPHSPAVASSTELNESKSEVDHKLGTPEVEEVPQVDGVATKSSTEIDGKVPEKYFIVKSLTLQDLESSVRNGVWATQSHNESALNDAYKAAENVFLIFSANKSGEYFGYAKMASSISGEAVRVGLGATAGGGEEIPEPTDGPKAIPTPPTATAPKGRIIDDSARGTIFWEAEHTDNEDDEPPKEGAGTGAGNTSSQEWGRQFQIEWLSTNRLPFYRTRGLRNPWNANREVKIARDGTELEPSVGKRLVSMFHRPLEQQPPNAGMAPGPGIAYVRN